MKPSEVDWEDVAREVVGTLTHESDILRGWGIEGIEADVERELAGLGVDRCTSCRVWFDNGDADDEGRCIVCACEAEEGEEE